MNRILVIGSTGNIGREVVSQLQSANASVRAMVRNLDTARLPPSVEMMQGDLTVPKTLDPCLDGIDSVFLVWVAPQDAVAPAIERIAKYGPRIVLLTAPLKTPHPFFQQPNPSRIKAEHIERTILSSGLRWTFLRAGLFALNSIGWWRGQIRAGDIIRWPYAGVETAPVHEGDIAAVALRALLEDHNGAEYVLTGPQSLTQAAQIETIGQVLGRPLRMEEISPEEWMKTLPPGFPPMVGRYLLDAWAAAAGLPAHATSTIESVTGQRARTFLEWALGHAKSF